MSGCDDNLFEFVPTEQSASVMPSCAQFLAFLVDAYYRILGGQKEIKVEYRDHSVWYSNTNIAELKMQIARLHSTCGNEASGVIVGGKRRAASVRFGNCRGVHCG